MNLKFLVGLLLALLIGLGCHAIGVPLPAPPVLVGALLVVAMTSGYMLADKLLAGRGPTTMMASCGGPTGRSRSQDESTGSGR